MTEYIFNNRKVITMMVKVMLVTAIAYGINAMRIIIKDEKELKNERKDF